MVRGVKKTESCSDAAAADPKPTLNQLPNEVLLPVWIHLKDPAALSLVNKRFQKLSKDTLWRAKWFMQRYEIYLVIFEAIARPELFTGALLERLVRLGAPLSRSLLQLVQLMWNATVRELMLELDESIRWVRVSLSAHSALMQHASNIYGESLSFDPDDCQSCIFHYWLESQEYAIKETELPRIDDAVRRLFDEQDFMPLPLSAEYYDEGICVVKSLKHVVTQAIVHDRELAPAAVRNGYLLTTERTEEIIDEWLKIFGYRKASSFVTVLKVDGVVNVSRYYATLVFDLERVKSGGKLRKGWKKKASRCSLLYRLNLASALPFRLEDVIEEVSAPVQTHT